MDETSAAPEAVAPFTLDEANDLPNSPEFNGYTQEEKERIVDKALYDVHNQFLQEDDYDPELFNAFANKLRERTDPSFASKAWEDVKGAGAGLVGLLQGAATLAGQAVIHPIDTVKFGGEAAAYNTLDWGRTAAEALVRNLPGATPNKLEAQIDQLRKDIDTGKLNPKDADSLVAEIQKRSDEIAANQEGSGAPLASEDNAKLLSLYIHTRNPKAWKQLRDNLARTVGQNQMDAMKKGIVESDAAKRMNETPLIGGEHAAENALGLVDPSMALVGGVAKGAKLIVGERLAGKASSAARTAVTAGELGAIGAAMAERQPGGATLGEMGHEAFKMILMGGAMHARGIIKDFKGPKVETETPTQAPEAVAGEGFNFTPEEVAEQSKKVDEAVADYAKDDEPKGLMENTAPELEGQPIEDSAPAKPLTNLDVSNRLNDGGFIASDVLDHAINTIKSGITDFAAWSVEMVKKFGEKVRDYLKDLWAVAQTDKGSVGGNVFKEKEGNAKLPEQEVKYGIHNEARRQARERDKLDELPEQGVVSEAKMVDTGRLLRQQDPSAPKAILDRFRQGGRNLTWEEQAVLMHEAVDIRKQYDGIEARYEASIGTPDQASATAEMNRIRDMRNDLDNALRTGASDPARMLRFRQTYLGEDYSLQRMQARALRTRGLPESDTGQLTPEQKAERDELLKKVEEQFKEIEDYRKQIDGLKERLEKVDVQDIINKTKDAGGESVDTATVKKSLKKAAKKGEIDNLNLNDLEKMMRNLIGRGITEVNALTKAMSTIIKMMGGTMEEQDIRRALTKYGQVKFPSGDAVKKRAATAKQEMLLIEKLNDVKRNIMYAKTGMQRHALTAEARELQKQLNDLVREKGLTRDSEAQGKNARDRIVTGLKNAIEEVTRIIEGKSKLREKKAPAPDDAETAALRKELKELRDYLSDLTGRQDLSADEYSKKVLQASNRIEQYYKDRLRKQDWQPEQKKTFKLSEAAQKAKDAAKEARQAYEDWRNATHPDWNREAEIESAKKKMQTRIGELVQILQSRKDPRKPAAQKPLDAEGQAMQQELQSLQKAVAEWRKTQVDNDAKRAKAAERSLEKSISELERRIKEGDTAPREKMPKPQSDRLKMLEQQRDFLREIYDGIKEATREQKDPLEAQLERYKKILQKQIDEYGRKIREKDYTPKTKKKLELTNELRKMQVAREKLKNQFEFDRQNDLDSRDPLSLKAAKKAVRGITDIILLSFPIYLKLAAAGMVVRPAMKMIENTVGGAVLKRAMPWINELASSEGTHLSLADQISAYSQGFKTGLGQMKNAELTGMTQNQMLYSKKGLKPQKSTALSYVTTKPHAAMKAAAWEGAFNLAVESRLKKEGFSNRLDVPEEKMDEIYRESAKDADYDIYRNENWINKAWSSGLRSISHTGNTGAIVSEMLRYDTPIAKIPTNLVLEASHYIAGLPLSITKALSKAARAGELKPEEYNSIARTFKKGTVFAGLVALAAMFPSAIQVGGNFIRGEKRKEDEDAAGDVTIFGVHIPHVAAHAGIFTAAQTAGTFVREWQKGVEKGENPIYNAAKTGLEGVRSATQQIPMVGGLEAFVTNFIPGEDAARMRDQALRKILPQSTRTLAEQPDYQGEHSLAYRLFVDPDRKNVQYRGSSFQSTVPYVGAIHNLVPYPNRLDLPTKKRPQ